jgi:hypothetical protein
MLFFTFLADKNYPRHGPGYYLPRVWYTQKNDVSFLVMESKHDLSDVQGGEDFSVKPFAYEIRRSFIDLSSGRLTRYVEETGFKDGSIRVIIEDVFLLFYPELPDDIAEAINSLE